MLVPTPRSRRSLLSDALQELRNWAAAPSIGHEANDARLACPEVNSLRLGEDRLAP